MANAIKHHKYVAALPATLEADSVYYVRAGDGYDQYVTNSTGTIVAYPSNAAVQIGSRPRNVAHGSVLAAGDTVAVDIGDNLQLIARYNSSTPESYIWLCIGTLTGTQVIDFRASVLSGDTGVWYANGEGYEVTDSSSSHTIAYNYESDSTATLIMRVRLANGEVWECSALASGAGARITLMAERWS